MKSPFSKIFVINLQRRPDRWEQFRQSADRFELKYERFEAIDGKLIDRPSIPVKWKETDEMLTVGMLGCYLSHLAVLRQSYSEQLESALILEDDAVFIDDFEDNFKRLWDITPQDWDMLYLARAHWDERGQLSDNADLSPLFKSSLKAEGIWRSTMSKSAYAYAVSRNCIPYLLDRLSVMERPIDEQYSTLHRNLTVYAYHPAIIKHRGSVSDIWKSKPFVQLENKETSL